MKSQLDGVDLFHAVPMWMCPTCGRTVTLPFGTSTSMPRHTICECAGYLGNDGRFHGHFTAMVPNEAGRRLDENLRKWQQERWEREKDEDARRSAISAASSERWSRVYQELGDVDGWRPLALPCIAYPPERP